MKIRDSVAFVTTSSGRLGRSLVDNLLERGAARVYAASRSGGTWHGDPRVTPVRLDATRFTEIAGVAAFAHDTQLVINDVGPLDVVRAFLPTLRAHDEAAVVNVMPASHAPAWSVTEALREELAGTHVRVHAVIAGAGDVARAILDCVECGTCCNEPVRRWTPSGAATSSLSP